MKKYTEMTKEELMQEKMCIRDRREGDLHYEQYSKNENRYSCGKP